MKYIVETTDLRVRSGDVLFNNTNSAELVGKTAVFDQDGDYSFSNHLTRLRSPLGVSPHFLAYQFLYLWREGYFRLRSTQHVSQASVNSRTLTETVPLVVAPRGEQERIVAELSRHFDLLRAVEASVRAALTRLREYERLVVIAAAQGELVRTEAELAGQTRRSFESGTELLKRIEAELSEVRTGAPTASAGGAVQPTLLGAPPQARNTAVPDRGALASLPDGWAWARVDQVGIVTLGRQRAPQHHDGPNMRPYLRVANVFENRIDTSDVHEMNFTPEEYETYALEHGDILLNEGQSPELVGRPAMFRGEVPGVCFQNTLIRFRARHGVSPGFALLVFRAYLHTGRFRAIAKWTTNIAHLGFARFASLEFPLPPLAEQERIVAEADRRLELAQALADTLRSIFDRIEDVRDAALSLAFTGSLVASDSDELSAEQLLHEIRSVRADALDVAAKPKNGQPMSRTPVAKRRARKPLRQVLEELNRPLSPEELLAESGIGEDLIDDFFAELKWEYDARHIVQRRDGQGRVQLVLTGGA